MLSIVSRMLNILPDLVVNIEQKALWDYFLLSRSNKMIRFQWYLSVSQLKHTVEACLKEIPIIGDWLADEVVKAIETKQTLSKLKIKILHIKTPLKQFQNYGRFPFVDKGVEPKRRET
eukprot:scaffold571_cov34-Cyclotella_meneghiniana.AAC.5